MITDIIRHQRVFFSLLDYIDTQDGSLEFPENLYMHLYRENIAGDNDRNVPARLSIDSLIENGVFIHNDKNTGYITVEKIIVDLLRFLDIKRSKELTSVDLEQLRKRTYDLTLEIKVAETNSDKFVDLMASLNMLLNEVHSSVKENVAGLHAQVGEIAKDYKAFDSGSGKISVFDLYERVTALYRKYVLPCFEFIDPAMQMKQTLSFSQSIQSLIKHLAKERSMISQSNMLQYRFSAISSYYKDLGSLVKRLEQFSGFLERDRTQFMAVEKAFTVLMENVAPLRHGMVRNRFITSSFDFFEHITAFDGLRSQKAKYSAKEDWETNRTSIRFKEYLSLLDTTELPEKKRKDITYHPAIQNSDEKRLMTISRLLFEVDMPEIIPDIHIYLLNILRDKLDDFWLGDVLLGLQEMYPVIDEHEISYLKQKQFAEYGSYYLEYLVISFKEVKIHV
ncbi:hypothetical protein [Idiomarina abyssalis]|uniref:hypothetical protein n=1 Tax=Idiomarina abyssalis TaxID=86102 RepID=UPI003A8D8CA3